MAQKVHKTPISTSAQQYDSATGFHGCLKIVEQLEGKKHQFQPAIRLMEVKIQFR
jgi:hypothetical protein